MEMMININVMKKLSVYEDLSHFVTNLLIDHQIYYRHIPF